MGIGTSSPLAMLSVAGDAYIGGNFTATGTLAITGASTLASTLGVSGLSTLAGLISTASSTIDGALTSTGAVNFGSTLDVTGATNITNTLGVTGLTTLANAVFTNATGTTLAITGTATTSNLYVSNTAQFDDVINVNGTTGTSTFAGGLAIETTGFVYDRITNRVGIGTAAPKGSLDVQKSSTVNVILSTDSGNQANIIASNLDSESSARRDLNLKARNLGFYTGNSSGSSGITERLTILHTSGKVGIGTTTPSVLLTVGSTTPTNVTGYRDVFFAGSAEIDGLLYVDSTGTSTIAGGLDVAAINQTGSATSTFATGISLAAGCYSINGTCLDLTGTTEVSSGTQGQVAFYSSTGSLVSGTSSLFITESGSVGIGTTSTSTLLTIDGPGSLDGIVVGSVPYPSWMGDNGLYLEGTIFASGYLVNNTDYINWGDSTTGIRGDSTLEYISFRTDSIERARFATLGLGLGTTTPFEALTVAGNMFLGGNLTATGTLTLSGAATLSSTLGVSGLSTLAGLISTASSTIDGALTVTGATDINNTLDVSGATNITNTLGVTGLTTLANAAFTNATGTTLAITGTATTSQLYVSNATQLDSTLTVEGASTFNNTLAVTGLSTLAGYISTASSTVNGNFTATGDLALGGDAVISGTGTSTFAGGVQTQTLDVAGSATSTFATGIDLATGCFSIGGSCLDLSGSVSILSDLTDVDTTNVTYGNILFYTGASWATTSTSTLNIAIADTVGTLSVGRGGTGSTTPSMFLFGDGAGAFVSTSSIAQNFLDSSVILQTEINTFTLLDTLVADKDLVNLNDAQTFASLITFTSGYISNASSTVNGNFTVAGVTNLQGQLSASSSATSTFATGITLDTGCYAIGGVCLDLSGDTEVSAGTQGQIAFYSSAGSLVSGTSSLFIADNGYVGIGTTSPSQQFEVEANDPNIQFTATTNGRTLFFNPANGIIRASNDLRFDTGGSNERMRIDSSGNIGIGTTSPYSSLSVWADGSDTGALVFEVVDSASTTIFSVSDSSIFNYAQASTSTIPDSMTYAWSIATGSTAVPIFEIDTSGSGQYATSSFIGGFDINNGALTYDYSSNYTSIERLQLGNMTFDDDAGWVSWIDMEASTTPVNGVLAYTAGIDALDILTVYSESDGAGGIEDIRILIGTTTSAVLGSSNIPDYSLILGDGILCVDDGDGSCDDAARVAGGVYAETINAISTTASSTFANGIDLSNGCFAIGGVCLDLTGTTEVASGLQGQIAFYDAAGALVSGTSSITINQDQTVDIITDSTFTNATGTTLAITGTATTSNLYVSNTAQFDDVINVNSTTGTSTFAGGLAIETSGLVYDHSTGFVGIGTAAPDSVFEIVMSGSAPGFHMDSSSNALIELDRGGSGSKSAIRYQTAGTTNWITGLTDGGTAGDGSEFFIGQTVGGADADFWIETDGSVGIGTSTPFEALTVAGNTFIGGNITATGTLAITGAATLSSTLGVSGLSTLAGLISTASSTIDGALTATGAVSLGSTLDVTGITTLANTTFTNATGTTLAITGTATTSNLYVSNTAQFSDVINVNGTTGTSTFAGGLAIETSGFVYDYSTNRVGIGTAAPENGLHLTSSGGRTSFRIQHTGGTNPGDFRITTSNDENAGGDSLIFEGGTDSTRYMTINSSGYIGIGTTTPFEALTVAGNAFIDGNITATGTLGVQGTGTSTIINGLSVGTFAQTGSATSTFAQGISLTDGCYAIAGVCLDLTGTTEVSSGTQGQIAFYSSAGSLVSGTSSLFIADSGNVGIGTTSPEASLTISGGTGLVVEDADGSDWFSVVSGNILFNAQGGITQVGGSGDLGARLNVSTLTNSGKSALALTGVASPSANIFEVNSIGDQSGDLFVIDKDGNVGIGTSTPSELLQIVSGTDPTLVLTNSGTNQADSGKISFREGNTTERFNIEYDGLNNRLNFVSENVGTVMTLTKATGYVGIGTSTPFETLSVGGGAYIGGNLTATGTLAVQGTGTSTITNGLSVGTFAQTGSATSTFAAGITLTDGCYAIAGVCLDLTGTTEVSSGTQGQIAFYSTAGSLVSGTSTLFIADNGYVGVGTTSPESPLHIEQSGQNGLTFTRSGHETMEITLLGSNRLSFINNNDASESMVISDSGNVGIGTTSPSEALEIAGNIRLDDTTPEILTWGTGNVRIGNTATGYVDIGGDGVRSIIQAPGNELRLLTTRAADDIDILVNSTTTMTFDGATAFVGIRDASPDALLEVADASTFGSPDLFMLSSSINADGDLLIVTNSGDVGIGTTTPSAKFAVAGSTFLGGNLTATGTLALTGAANLSSTLNVQGQLSASSSATSTFAQGINIDAGCFSVSGTCLDLTGTTEVSSGNQGEIAFYDANGSLISGTSTLTIGQDQSLTASSLLTLAAGYVSQASSTVDGAFTATGAVAFGSTVDITGATNIINTLGVTGLSTLAGLISTASSTIDGVLTVTGVGEFGSTINVNGTSATSTFAGGLAIETSGFVYDHSTGNVGIGTAAPDARLDIESGTADLLSLRRTGGTGSVNFTLYEGTGTRVWNHTVTSGGAQYQINDQTAGTNPFIIEGNAPSNSLFVEFDGDVGIGTSSPYANLSVWADGSDTGARVFELIDSASTTIFSVSDSSIFNYAQTSTSTIPDGMAYAWSIATGSTAIPIFTIDTSGSGQYATSSFMGGFDINNGALSYDYSSNQTSIERLQLGAVEFEADAGWVSWIDMQATTTPADGVLAYSAQIDANKILTIYSQSDGSGGVDDIRVIIGTTTNAVLGSANIPDYSLILGNGVICVDDGDGSCADSARVAGGVYAETINSLDSSATSSFAGGVSVANLSQTGSATSTFATGIDLSTGCFSVNGTCLDLTGTTEVASGLQGQIAFYDAAGALVSGTSSITINQDQTVDIITDSTFTNATGTTLAITGTATTSNLYVSNTAQFDDVINVNGTTGTSTFAGGLAIETSGLVYDHSTGNVGIGTAAPAEKLNVSGNIFMDTNGKIMFRTTGTYINESSGLHINSASGQPILFETAGTENIRIASTGELGIGTTTPFEKLTVAGNAFIGGNLTATGTLTVTGATSLASTLGVSGLSTLAGLISTASSTIDGDLTVTGVGEFDTTINVNGTGATSTFAGGLAIETSGFVYDHSTGFVGIGTASPDSELQVDGGAGDVKIIANAANGSVSYLDLLEESSTSYGGRLKYDGGTNIFSIGTVENDVETLAIHILRASGDVGIGTTTPFEALTVAGNMFLGGNLTATGTLAITGAATLSSTLGVSGLSTLAGLISTASSTIDGALTITGTLMASGTATSTFANGIDVLGGCLAVNGSCVTSGAFGSAGGYTTLNTITDDVGIGSSTPSAKLTVVSDSGQTGNIFSVSTSSLLASSSEGYAQGLYSSVDSLGKTIVAGKVINPTVVGNWAPGVGNTMTAPENFVIQGDFAYVPGYTSDNLAIVDISDPENPIVVGNWDPNDGNVMEGARSVAVSGNYAYVAGFQSSNLAIVDISDPSNPVTVGNWDPNVLAIMEWAIHVAVSGNYAYVTGFLSDNLVIIDISDPTNPRLVGNWDPGVADTIDSPNWVVISGNYAYVTGYASDNLAIIDISDPTTPIEVGNWDPNDLDIMESATAVAISGTHAYISGRDSDNMAIVDISDPSAPLTVGNWAPADTDVIDRAYSVAVSGKYAYVTGYSSNSMSVVDVSSSTNPVSIVTVAPSVLTAPHTVVVSGNHAYVSGFTTNNLVIFDIGALDVANIEVGNIRADQLRVDQTAEFDRDINVRGSANIGQNAFVGGALTITGNASSTLAETYTGLAVMNGRVGIGTTSPSSLLHIIDGAGIVPSFAGGTTFIVQNNDDSSDDSIMLLLAGASGSSYIGFADATQATAGRIEYDHSLNALSFNTGATERMRIDSSGNVGIGTTSPDTALQVVGAITLGDIVPLNTATGDIVGVSKLAFGVNANGAPRLYNSTGLNIQGDANGIDFLNVSSVSSMFISDAGNVGIGTIDPEQELDVLGSGQFIDDTTNNRALIIARSIDDAASKSSAVVVRHWLNAEEPVTMIGAGIDGSSINDIRIGGGFSNNNAATRIQLFTASSYNTLNGTARMTIDSQGNVGIGTTSPFELLSVGGDAYIGGNLTATGTLTVTGAASLASTLGVTGLSTLAGLISTASSTIDGALTVTGVGEFDSTINVNSTTGTSTFAGGLAIETSGLVYDHSTGYVGIGTAAPTNLLTVSGGDALINGHTIGRGAGDISTNVVFGNSALASNSSGSSNVAIGQNALITNTSGSSNVAIGVNALLTNATGSSNVAIGVNALINNEASNNVALGGSALSTNTFGTLNVAIGNSALNLNTTGSNNMGIGSLALSANTTGLSNVAIGVSAVSSNTTGSSNVAFGLNALQSNISGNSTVAIGANAGNLSTGGNNIFIGTSAGESDTTGSKNIVIGFDIDSASTTDVNQLNIGGLIFGNGLDAADSSISSGNIGIGTSTPFERLTVAGNMFIGGNLTATGTLTVTGAASLASTLGVTGLSTLAGLISTASSTIDGALTATGAVSFTSTLDVTGAFTSVGIDDNATGERLQIEDTALSLGVSGANYTVNHAVNDRVLTYSGGNSSSAGANLQLFGGTYSGSAKDLRFRSDSTDTLYYDDSASSWNFQANDILTTGNVGIGTTSASAKLTVQGDAGDQTDLFILATSTGSTTLSVSNNGALTLHQINPMKVGGIDNGTSMYSIVVSGDYAFMPSSTTGDEFEIYNIATDTPFKVGGAALGGQGNSVAIFGNYAYVGSESGGDDIDVFDVSDKTNPTIIGGVDAGGPVNHIEINGGYAYASTDVSGEEFQVYDVSDPSNIVQVSSIDMGDRSPVNIISGNYAYVGTYTGGDGVEIVDISDPRNLIGVGTIALNDTVRSLVISGTYIYVGTGDGSGDNLEIYDIADPINPVKVSGIEFGGEDFQGLAVLGDYVYVITGGTLDMMLVYNISDPTNPIEVARTSLASDGYGIKVVGNRAYVVSNTTGDEFEIFDIGGITSASAEIGTILANSIATDNLHAEYIDIDNSLTVVQNAFIGGALTVTGNASSTLATGYTALAVMNGRVGIGTSSPYAKLSVWADGTGTGATIFELVDSASTTVFAVDDNGNATTTGYLAVTSTTASSTFANGIDLSAGCFAVNGTCLTGGSGGFSTSGGMTTLVTIADNVGVGTTTASAKLTVQGDAGDQTDLFVLATSTGSTTLSVNNNGALTLHQINPVKVGGVNNSSAMKAIEIVGDYAYIGSDTTGDEFEIWNIATNTPFKVGGVAVGDQVISLALVGNYVYVGSESGGDDFEVYDVSDKTNPVLISGIDAGAAVNDIVIVGGYAYLSTDNTSEEFQVYDVLDPTNLVKVASINQTTLTYALAVSGNYAYVGTYVAGVGVEIIDISNPRDPLEVGTITLSDDVRTIVISGAYLYVVNDGTGDDFEIYDLADPINPTQVAGVDLGSDSAYGLYISGDYAYITRKGSSDDLVVYDISDRTNPVQIGRTDVDGDGHAVVVSGNRAFVISVTTGDELEIFDIGGVTSATAEIGTIKSNSIATDNLRAGFIDIDNSLTVGQNALIGGALTITGNASSTLTEDYTALAVMNGRVGIGTTTPQNILDVAMGGYSSPAINIIGSTGGFTNRATIGFDFNSDDTTGFILGSGTGADTQDFYLYDFNDGAFRFVVDSDGNFGIGTTTSGSKLTVQGTAGSSDDLFILATSTGAVALSVNNNGALSLHQLDPMKVGGISGVGSLYDMVISGDYAYIPSSTGGDDEFEIFNIATNTPFIVGGVALADQANGVALVGNYAYVVTESTGDDLHIIDVSDKTNPTLISGVDVGANVNDIVVVGNYAYLSTEVTDEEFQVYDISSTTNMVKVSGIDVGDRAYKTAISGNYAYVGTYSGSGVEIVDISDPTNVISAGNIAHTDTVRNVMISGGYIFVGTDDSSGDNLDIFDLADPINPVKLSGVVLASEDFYGLDVSGDYVYVTTVGTLDLLLVYDISDPTNIVEVARTSLSSNGNVIKVSGNRVYVGSSSTDDNLEVFDIGGITSASAEIGNIRSTDIATENLRAEFVDIGNSLNVTQNALIGGALTITGNASSTLATTYTALAVMNGYVGIGTSTPAQLLEISADTGKVYSQITSNDGSDVGLIFMRNGSNRDDWRIENEGGLLDFSWSDDNGLNWETMITFDRDSADRVQVGINESSPNALLEISGQGEAGDEYLMISSDDGNDGDVMIIDAAGNIGFGTTSASAKLTIQGDAGDQTDLFALASSTGSVALSVNNNGALTLHQIIPMKVGGIDEGSSMERFVISGDYAYIPSSTNGDEFEIWNIATNTPFKVGGAALGDWGNAVVLVGNYAYVTSESGGDDIVVFDISDKTNPTIIGGVDVGGNANQFVIDGSYGYLSTDVASEGFQVYDISSTTNLVKVASVDVGDDSYSLAISGNYAYVGTYTSGNGIEIIDIADPTNPFIVGNITLSDTTGSMVISGTYLYVGTRDTGDDFEIYDISDPTNPTKVSGIDFGSSEDFYGLFISGDYAYITTSGSGDYLLVYDISDVSNPTLIAQADTSSNAYIVVVSGNRAFVGSNTTGDEFEIFDIGGITSASAEIGTIKSNSIATDKLLAEYIDIDNSLSVAQNAFIGGALTVTGNASSTLATTYTALAVMNGNVGIGTSTTTYDLEVYGSDASNIYIRSTGANANLNIDRASNAFKARVIYWSGGVSKVALGLDDDGTDFFHIGDTSLTNKWLTVDTTSGFVGIGTTTPKRKLSVVSTEAVVAQFVSDNSAGAILNIDSQFVGDADSYIRYTVDGTAAWSLGVDDSDSDKFVISSGNGLSAGLLTIGTSGVFEYGQASTSTIPDSMVYAWSIATSSTAVPIFEIDTSGSGQYATSSFMGGFDVNNGAIHYDFSSNKTSIERLDLGNVTFEDDAGWVSWIDMAATTSSAGDALAYSAQIDSNEILTIYSQSDGSGGITDVRVLVGTSTDAVLGSSNIPYGSLIVADGIICVDDGGASNCDDAQRYAGGLYATSTTVTAIDLAENYPTKDTDLVGGDLVMFDPTNPVFVTKFDASLDTGTSTLATTTNAFVGVISTAPGVLLGGFADVHFTGETKVPVTLAGRVPVKVDLSGGDIAVGDRLTYSYENRGVATKATTTGQSLGIALEYLSGTTTATGTILAFIDPQLYIPETVAFFDQLTIDSTGNIGIGTTTTNNKVQIGGDIAATGFINVSLASTKKDIAYLDIEDKKNLMNVVRDLDVAEYRYEFEATSSPLRLGFIAEDAPKEILSANGDGIDLYKLSSLNLAAIQTIDMRISDIEVLLGMGSTSSSTLDLGALGSESIIETVLEFFASIGVWFENGITTIANLVTDNLTIGSADAPAGIQLYDEVSGDPYCVTVYGGELVSTAGVCGTVSGGSGGGGGAVVSGDTEAPTIVITGNNPATINMGESYNDLGALVTDNKDLNLGLSYEVNGVSVSGVSIDTSSAYSHTIVYSATDNAGNTRSVTRIVNVIDPNAGNETGTTTPETAGEDGGDGEGTGTTTPEVVPEPVEDTEAPVITVLGDNPLIIESAAVFIDPGAVASDNIDGDITDNMTTDDGVDPTTLGDYLVTYTITDAAGNFAVETRSVTVIEAAPEPDPEPDPVATTTPDIAEESTGTTTPST